MVHAVLRGVLGREVLQVARDLVIVVDLEELEVGARLQQVGNALGLLDARELEKDLALLVLELLDVGGHDAELVDTCAEDVEGRVDLAVDLLVEGLDHLGVRGVAAQLAHVFTLADEEAGQSARLQVGGNLVDEVAVARLGAGVLCLLDGRVDLGELCVARRVLAEDVGHRNLEHDVHAALEVKAEAHLHLADLVVGVSEIYLLLVD